MTQIPGTATPTKPVAAPPPPPKAQPGTPALPLARLPEHQVEFQVTTVSNVKPAPPVTGQATTTSTNTEVAWYMHQFSWMMFGAIIGLICVLIGLKYPSFFYLGPLGPTLGIVAWYVRAFMMKYGKNFDPMGGR